MELKRLNDLAASAPKRKR